MQKQSSEGFFKKSIMKNFSEFTRKHLCRKTWCKSGTRTPRAGTSGPWDPGHGTPPQSLKVTPGTPLRFKSGVPSGILDLLERIWLHRICWIYMRNPLKRLNKSGKGCFWTAEICKYTNSNSKYTTCKC